MLPAAALAVFTTTRGLALDETPSPRVSLSYSAGASCPAEPEFWDQVMRHLRRFPEASLRPIHVEVDELEGHALARVTFEDDRGTRATRELSGKSCGEAAAAAALVVALAIDAQIEQSTQTPAAPAPAKPATAGKPPLKTTPAPAPAQASEAIADRKPLALNPKPGLYWQLGAGAVAEYAPAPAPLFGVLPFFGIGEREPRWQVRASFVYARSGVAERRGQSAEFILLGGRLEGCALPFVSENRFTLGPCLAIELGSLLSSGQDTESFQGRDDASAWLALGPLLRARQAFAELEIELFVGPWFPMAGARGFTFERSDSETAFHDVPWVGWTAGAGLSFALP